MVLSIFKSSLVIICVKALHGNNIVRDEATLREDRRAAAAAGKLVLASLSAPSEAACDAGAKSVCGASVELCGTLANGGHNGATQIHWARSARLIHYGFRATVSIGY